MSALTAILEDGTRVSAILDPDYTRPSCPACREPQYRDRSHTYDVPPLTVRYVVNGHAATRADVAARWDEQLSGPHGGRTFESSLGNEIDARLRGDVGR